VCVLSVCVRDEAVRAGVCLCSSGRSLSEEQRNERRVASCSSRALRVGGGGF